MSTVISVTPAAMRPGDTFAPFEGARVISSIARDMADLCAYVLTFEDGSHFHAHQRQAYTIGR